MRQKAARPKNGRPLQNLSPIPVPRIGVNCGTSRSYNGNIEGVGCGKRSAGQSGVFSKGGILEMKLQRKYSWILTLLLAVPMLSTRVPAAQPQGGGYGGGRGEGGRRGPMSPNEELKRMTKEFQLTADQQSKIKPILVDEQKKIEDLRSDSTADRETMRGKMMQIRQGTYDQVRALLDDKQKESFDKLEKERQERMQNRRGGGPGGDNSGGNPPPPQN
jgi:Spy/CpxP family protein refolding chaperone